MKMKSKNIYLSGMIGTLVIGGGLFAYQNVYLAKQNPEQVIYVAKKDIPAESEITEDMLEAVSIPADGVLPTYVTDKKEIVGKKLLGGLLKSEPLSKSRLTTEENLENQLELKIDYDNDVPLVTGDYINIYVILESNGGEINVQKLFERKMVTVSNTSSADGTTSFNSLKVSEKEALDYYNAREIGKLVVVKDTSLDGKEDITTQQFDSNSDEVKNAVKPSDESSSEGISIVTKKIEEGDTLEDLARTYKTDVNTIKKLNNDKSDFNIGDEINLPAN